MNRRKLMTISSMALALIGVSASSQAEDGSLRLRTMLAEQGFGPGVSDASYDGSDVSNRERLIMNNDELFLKIIKENEDKDS